MSYTFSAAAEATSTDPHDWGRAMSVALCHLLEQARKNGADVGHEHLYGEDLHLQVREHGHGVQITLTWTAESEVPSGAAQ